MARFGHRSINHTDIRESRDRVILGHLVSHQVDGLHDRIIPEPCIAPLAREWAPVLAAARKAVGAKRARLDRTLAQAASQGK